MQHPLTLTRKYTELPVSSRALTYHCLWKCSSHFTEVVTSVCILSKSSRTAKSNCKCCIKEINVSLERVFSTISDHRQDYKSCA